MKTEMNPKKKEITMTSIDCGASSNGPVSVASGSTITFTNTNARTINLTTPQGLTPQGAHQVVAGGTETCTRDASSGTNGLIYNWQEIGPAAPRNGTINVS
jgi:hypothetical protein